METRENKIDFLNLLEEKQRRKDLNPLKYVQMHLKQKIVGLANRKLRALFWGNRCFAKGTLISTPNGDIKIEDIRQGDIVYTMNEDILTTERVDYVMVNGVDTDPKPMIEFTYGTRTIRATYDHPIIVNEQNIPLYNLAWRRMDASQRVQLELLCKQYGQDLVDPILWSQGEDWSDASGNRQAWVLSDSDGWQDGEGSQGSGYDLDIELHEQADGESHQQQSSRQPSGEFGMGDTQGTISSSDQPGQTDEKLGGKLQPFQDNPRAGDRDIQLSEEASNAEEDGHGQRSSQDLSDAEGRLNQRHLERQELEICKVSIHEAEVTYNINVAFTHNYFANGLNVANCGKTEFGAMETARILLGQHKFIRTGSGGDVWALCPSFDVQKDTTQPKLLRYIPKDRIVSITWLRKGIIKEMIIEADNGQHNSVIFKSYEQGREKVQGAGKCFIWFDEEPPKDIFDECAVRQEAGISLYILMTMTPINGMTWVYSEVYLNTSNPDIFVSEATWNDNPFLTEDQKNEMRRRLTPQALKVREEGKFVKQVGLVAGWFSRSIHVIEMDSIPPGDTILSVDFGFSNPCAGLFGRIDRDGNVWIFDGWYRRKMINPDIQAVILQKESGIGRVNRIGDSAQSADIEQLTKAGIPMVGISKTSGSKESWDEYRARILEQYGRVNESTNKPKIFISSKLVDIDDNEKSPTVGSYFNFLMQELENLRWEEKKEHIGEDNKAVWGKQPNHAIDALTYMLVAIDTGSRKESRGITQSKGMTDPFYGLMGN